MNYEIIRRELKLLIRIALQVQELVGKNETSGLKDSLFFVDSKEIQVLELDRNKKELEEKTNEFYKGQQGIKDNLISKYPAKFDKKIKDRISTNQRKITRQEIILNFIKKKNIVNIKDLFGVINNCSSKTIQRELLDMVKKNVLKKEGERRWSRYSLR
jgi:hypothetical protein